MQRNKKLAQRPLTEPPYLSSLIETRGEGGYSIGAPSSGDVHPSGLPYLVQSGHLATIPTLLPEERALLLSVARTLDEIPPLNRHFLHIINSQREHNPTIGGVGLAPSSMNRQRGLPFWKRTGGHGSKGSEQRISGGDQEKTLASAQQPITRGAISSTSFRPQLPLSQEWASANLPPIPFLHIRAIFLRRQRRWSLKAMLKKNIVHQFMPKEMKGPELNRTSQNNPHFSQRAASS